VLSFWMLQSARVQPYSSCSPADWNLHLEGYGLVVLEWDNLAVEGGPNLGPRQEETRSRWRGVRGGDGGAGMRSERVRERGGSLLLTRAVESAATK
jgi:hypothetical protein